MTTVIHFTREGDLACVEEDEEHRGWNPGGNVLLAELRNPSPTIINQQPERSRRSVNKSPPSRREDISFRLDGFNHNITRNSITFAPCLAQKSVIALCLQRNFACSATSNLAFNRNQNISGEPERRNYENDIQRGQRGEICSLNS